MKITQSIHAGRVVLALAVVAGLAVPAVTYGLGSGSLAAAASPRTTVSATPTMALTGSLPSQSAMATAATMQPTATATTPQQTTPGTTQPTGTSKGSKTAAGGPQGGAAATSGKEMGKGVVPMEEPAAGPEISLTAGWNSKYIFKSRDNVNASSLWRDDDSSIWYTKVSLAYKGLGASLGYVQAVEKTLPRRGNGETGEYYKEVVGGVNYTAALIGGYLDATVGYNAYFFPEDSFWGGDYQGEAYATLAYVQFPWFRPSITYSYFHDNTFIDLTGYWIDFRVDSTFEVFNNGNVAVALCPYVSVGYNGIDYTWEGADWSAVEIGLRVPITINDKLTIALSGNYGWDLGENQSQYDGSRWGEIGFWGGASVTYRF